MPSETTESAPASLLEPVRKIVPNRDMLLVADHPPSPVPEWIFTTMSSSDILATPQPKSRRAYSLLLTPWVEPDRLDAVIAHLRDILALELYVLHPGDAVEQTRRMGALGLHCLETIEVEGQPWGLNHFSLKTYKKTPGWLNNRHWANPQLWNKFRW